MGKAFLYVFSPFLAMTSNLSFGSLDLTPTGSSYRMCVEYGQIHTKGTVLERSGSSSEDVLHKPYLVSKVIASVVELNGLKYQR
jgi:hypothetical protein